MALFGCNLSLLAVITLGVSDLPVCLQRSKKLVPLKVIGRPSLNRCMITGDG